MKHPTLTSRPDLLMCPLCGTGELRTCGREAAWCSSCAGVVGWEVLGTLQVIAALPDVLGGHSCECGHPEMRLLPDGTYHCPACGSEVLPVETSREPTPEYRSEAYRCGWIDGRFEKIGCFTENPNLIKWQDIEERLAYYRGHRAGTEARWVVTSGQATKDQELGIQREEADMRR